MKVAGYKKNVVPELDQEFLKARCFGKVKLGTNHIFWKKMVAWSYAAFADVCRVYRRVEAVDTKMCCGSVNFDIQKLVLAFADGTETELVVGEGTPKEAEQLFAAIQELHPELSFGKREEP